MDRNEMEGRWTELKGKVRQKWGQLSDDEIAQTQGKMEELAGKIQAKYGGSKEQIRRELERM